MAPSGGGQDRETTKLPVVVEGLPTARAEPPTARLVPRTQADIAFIELPPTEPDDPYVLSGLGLVDPSFFDDMFELDWTHSDVDRIVRDAVERKRIKAILQHWYRVLVLYFRQYAGKTALASTRPSSTYFTTDLQQIPNRLSLLEDLNVPCVDPAKFGLTDTPMRREGLITFVTHAAKMVSLHATNAVQFRVFAAEGIEMSEAVRSLMVDHVAVYAQLQDAAHFRDVFLLDHHDRQGRRLRHILTKHEGRLSSFFFEAITTATAATGVAHRVRVRSDSYRLDRLQTPAATTMSFFAFVTVLKTLEVIPPSGPGARQRPVAAAASGASSDTTNKVAVVTLDENRAMRIFQQCLDLRAELSNSHRLHSAGGSAAMAARQQLTYPQFVEALLRITLIQHETVICRGGFDICPGQQTSDVCRCRTQRPDYDLAAFDDAIDLFFKQIHALRLQRASNKRTGLKIASPQALAPSGRQHSANEGSMRILQRHHALIVEPEPSDDRSPESDSDDDDETS